MVGVQFVQLMRWAVNVMMKSCIVSDSQMIRTSLVIYLQQSNKEWKELTFMEKIPKGPHWCKHIPYIKHVPLSKIMCTKWHTHAINNRTMFNYITDKDIYVIFLTGTCSIICPQNVMSLVHVYLGVTHLLSIWYGQMYHKWKHTTKFWQNVDGLSHYENAPVYYR